MESIMPCRDYDLVPETIEEVKVKPSLLCEACALLEETGLLVKASVELQDWYKKHEAGETDRLRLEAAQKLTERERRLLGINIEALRSKINGPGRFPSLTR
jgi:hypothetical protein